MKYNIFAILLSFMAVSAKGQTYSTKGLIRNAENIHDFFHHSESQTEKLLQILKIDTANFNQKVDIQISEKHHKLTLKNFLIIKEILNLNIMQAIVQAYYDRPALEYYEKLRLKLNQKDFYLKLSTSEAKVLYEDLQLMLLSINALKKVKSEQHPPKFHYKYQIEEHIDRPYVKLLHAALFTATAMGSYFILADLVTMDSKATLWLPKFAFTISLATYFTYKSVQEVREYFKSKKIKKNLRQVDRFKNIPKDTIMNLKIELENLNNSLLNPSENQKPVFCKKLFY